MKNKILVIIGIIFVILLLLIVFIFGNKNNYLHDISYQELNEKINNKESFILYVRRESCPHCKEFKPIFTNVLNAYEIDAYAISLDILKENEATYTDDGVTINGPDLFITGTPTVVFYKNGKETSELNRIVGTQDKNTVIKKLKKMGYIK